MIDLDRRVGTENFPDVPEPDFTKVIFSVNVHGAVSLFKQMQAAMAQIEVAFVEGAKKNQSNFTLWPPVVDRVDRRRRKREHKRDSDSHFPPQHPVFHNKPDFNRKEAIRNARTKQLSRPIGSQGCGFVWNRGRLSP